MNKNLKKVISAVAALAISASSFVAMAANYPDVDAAASYKQAVDELSALKVIEGYEDGTFQPDKLVTRAEFSKMIITALGSAELAQAEAAKGRDTEFTDVKGDHWAAGYVTAAVSQSIINGMGDGTFAPESNITYAQAMKMLVCAAGYEQWSVDKGGWPDGYMYWGNQLKVGNGVKDVTDSTEITRAQCAQMIDNLLTAPVCVDTYDYSYDQYGNKYPKLEAKDGYGVDYQSILIKNHKAYKVKGMVTATHKSDQTNVGEVTFKITTARNWLNEEDQVKKSDDLDPITALVGESKADEYLHQYVEAIIQETDDDEYEILSIYATGQNDEVVLSADDYDEDEGFNENKFYILKNGKSTSYKLSTEEDGGVVKLYVNGVEVEDGYTEETVDTYIVNNNVGNVTLIDTPGDSNSTDGKYDYIMVDYYLTGVVDSVRADSEDDIEISFAGGDLDVTAASPWTIDLTDEEVTYSFKADDADVEIADLEQYDVLSIQANMESGFDSSNFYDVKVAKASTAIEGKVSTYDSEEEEYTINGTAYKTATPGVSDLKAGDSYTLYLDVFGRIAYTDDLQSEKKIAILDAAYSENSGDDKAKLILADGSSVEYTVRDVAVSSDANVPEDVTLSKNIEWAKYVVYGNKEGTGTKKPAEERVVEYSVNASNELTVKENLTGRTTVGASNSTYKASNNKIGSYTIDPETTAFIYANPNDMKDIAAMSASTLVDGNSYDAYFFDKSSSNTYRFVIVTTGAGQYTPYTSMAVVKKQVTTTDEATGDTVVALSVVMDGEGDEEAKVVKVDDIATSAAQDLVEGDAIVFETDAEGYITKIDKLLVDLPLNTADAYANVYNTVIKEKTAVDELLNQDVITTMTNAGDDEAGLFFGPIIDNKGGITLGAVDAETGFTDTTAAETISYDSNVKFYTINYNYTSGQRVKVADQGAVSPISLTKSNYNDGDQTLIDWSTLSAKANPRFALVKTVADDAVEVYVIIPKTGTEIEKN